MSKKVSNYIRPYQKWICGKTEQPCELGPGEDGKCPHQNPCRPNLNIRAQRFYFLITIIVLSFGLFVISQSSTQFKAYSYNPGPVSNPHQTFEKNCMSCHGQENQEIMRLEKVHSGEEFVNYHVNWKDGKVKSSSCLNCHNVGEHPLNPHGMSQVQLAEISKKYNSKFSGYYPEKNCTTCHKEHQGRIANIAHLSDKQCQSCHQQKFESFEEGHSDFKNYPYKKRTNIVFDHNSHQSKHFPKHFSESNSDQFKCTTCHTPATNTAQMGLKSFDKSCISCHGDQVYDEGKSEKGWVLASVPFVDVESLKKKQVHIGSWPEDAEGELTSFKKHLLKSRSNGQSLIEWFEDNGIDDLEDAEQQDLEKAQKLIWSIKETFYELAYGDEHIINLLAKDLDKNAKSQLGAHLNKEVFKSVVDNWFKDLKTEVENYRDGTIVETEHIKFPELDTAHHTDFHAHGGLYFLNDDFTVRYRPTGHGDIFIKSWLDHSIRNGHNELFVDLGKKGSGAGSCLKCHSVEKYEDNQKAVIHWKGKSERIKSFSKFNHQPHLGLVGDNGCKTCHKIDSDADYANSFSDTNAWSYKSNFKNINKSTCVECHQSESENNGSCLTCHNYHVDGQIFLHDSFSDLTGHKKDSEAKSIQ